MDSSVSPKDEIWFLRVCHHISIGLYKKKHKLTEDCAPWQHVFAVHSPHRTVQPHPLPRSVYFTEPHSHCVQQYHPPSLSTPNYTVSIWFSFLRLTIYKSFIRFLNSGIMVKCVLLRNWCFSTPAFPEILYLCECRSVLLITTWWISPSPPHTYTSNTHAYINFPSVTQPTTQLSEP